jgi:hypothetical protein
MSAPNLPAIDPARPFGPRLDRPDHRKRSAPARARLRGKPSTNNIPWGSPPDSRLRVIAPAEDTDTVVVPGLGSGFQADPFDVHSRIVPAGSKGAPGACLDGDDRG